MIASEIAEHRGVKVHAVYTAKRQRVRRHLHSDVRAAQLLEFGEDAHQFERLRRGVHRLHHAPRQVIFDGADHCRGVARGAQH